jgi:hypothetical protein
MELLKIYEIIFQLCDNEAKNIFQAAQNPGEVRW